MIARTSSADEDSPTAEDSAAAATARPAWSLAAHACRTCLGRVLHDGGLFRCATCGAEAQGSPAAICGCGIRIKGGPTSRRPITGFYCGPNPERGPASPSEFVILFDSLPARVTCR